MDMDVETIGNARSKLTALCAAFGVEVPPLGNEGGLLSLIAEDRLTYDPVSERVTYKLAKPISLKNGESVDIVTFGEPTGPNLEFIHKDVKVESEGNRHIVNLADIDLMTARAIIKLGGVALGIQERMVKRDLSALGEVFGLLGFFA